MSILQVLTILAAAKPSMNLPTLVMVLLTAFIFLTACVVNRIMSLHSHKKSSQARELLSILTHTLNHSSNYVLRMDVLERRIYNMHGQLLPNEGMTFEESLALVHPDERETVRELVLQLEMDAARTAESTFRWDVSGREQRQEWRNLHFFCVADHTAGQKLPTTIFCTVVDQTEEVAQEQRDLEMTDKYRKVFEQSIVGLAFYDKDGFLITANAKMRELLKFQSEDDPFYYEDPLFDRPAFHEVLNSRHVEDVDFCTRNIITERGVNFYAELHIHPIYDEDGNLVYITLSIRDVTLERELYLRSKRNDMQIRRTKEDLQQYEAELQYLMEQCDMKFWRTDIKAQTVTFYKGLSAPERTMSMDEFKEFFVASKETIDRNFASPELFFNRADTRLCRCRSVRNGVEKLQWNVIDSVPSFDESGNFSGSFGLFHNVTDLIEKQELLKEETQRANESGKMKSVFMANMTHEIRTPLNAIVGFTDILPMLQSTEEKQEIIRIIMNNCDMLLRLINDILAISTFNNGGSLAIEPKEIDFAQTFNDACTSLAQRVQNPAIKFLPENPYVSLVTEIDNGRVQQIITNFVTNAIKHTKEGHIKLGYRYEEGDGEDNEGRLYIYCEDTGAGIPKKDQARIFERFVKLNDFVQGTGLGLSICKAIIDSYKGDIGIESEGEGKGSTFWMWIPCKSISCIKK